MKNKQKMVNNTVKHINFSPQITPYKVSVRKGIGDGNWMNFSKIIFEISLDNKRYYGDYFFSILQWAQERFHEITIIICDTLQRYNVMHDENLTEKEAFDVSRNLGKQWISQNQFNLQSLKIKPVIYHWDHWLAYKDEFEQNKNILHDLYDSNIYFKYECDKIFEIILNQFRKKYKDKAIIKEDIIHKVIKPYFFEETAVTAIFLPKLDGINAYPGSLHQIWGDFASEKLKGLLGFKNCIFLSLNLVKNNSSKQLQSAIA